MADNETTGSLRALVLCCTLRKSPSESSLGSARQPAARRAARARRRGRAWSGWSTTRWPSG
ncbi:hypothetical protein [Nocardioides convexus]|uniref:hypothetical protein n=1 Tax=Nocardioides convexus TaxID=2712224 RepID=UPI0024188EBA|nr:hypothetical protein [Nocardioides convexus]